MHQQGISAGTRRPHNQAHQARLRTVPHQLAILAAGSLLAIPAAHAQSNEELRSEIEALKRSVASLQAQRPAGDSAPAAGAQKGSFKVPGSETSIKIGGYIKADMIVSSVSAGANSQADLVLVPGQIPVGAAADNEKGQIKFHARQTRLSLGTQTPTSWGDLTTYVEMDFFGVDGNEVVSNSNNLRARHAFATLGGLTVGQTWSTFMDPGSLPETLDFGGPAGEIFIRQTQARWTQRGQDTAWSIALESPDAYLTRRNANGTTANAIPDDDRVPDIVGKFDFKTGLGRFAVAAMARNIRIDVPAQATPAAVAASDDKWGGALAVYGVLPTFGKDTLSFALAGGNVLGRYVGQALFTDGDVDATGQVHLNSQRAGIVSYRHYWSDTLRSTLALSAASASNPASSGSMNKGARSAHANLLWSPVANTTLGVEYIHGQLEKESGATGYLNRLQASAMYSF